jgi:hypothetical protein
MLALLYALPRTISHPKNRPNTFTSILQNWHKLADRETASGTVIHIVTGELNKTDQKQYEEGEERLAAAIWVTKMMLIVEADASIKCR